MCSTAAQRIAEIGRAIDDLAVRAAPGAGHADPIVARLAELWALLAELDPEVARRLAGYQALSAHAELGRRARYGRRGACPGPGAWPDRVRRQLPTISTSSVALTSGWSRTDT